MRHLLIPVLLVGCVGDIGGSIGDDDGSGSNEEEPVVCEQVRSYKGFAGTPLESDRLTIEPGSDRIRMKPFVALATEYERALGVAEVVTTSAAATFGRAPARWYAEPQASSNTVYAAFALAYGACTQKTALGGDFAEAPNANSAQRLCRDFAMAAWHREPSVDEITTCATFAVDKTNAADAPAKRWAYTCAAVLTASSFLTY
jgi:hypothetical protein